MRARSPLVVALIFVALLAVTISACGSSKSGATSSAAASTIKKVPCPGTPIVLGTITSLAGSAPMKDLMGGVEAAAAAVNEECAAGRPVKLVTCNDQGDPSTAADCGRTIVKSKAIALVGAGGVEATSFEPIVEGAGIPSIGNTSTSVTELAATTSFPFYSGLIRIAARCATHVAAGAKSVAIVIPENPALQSLLPTMSSVCQSFGLKVTRFVQIPIEATDLAQYASQAAESESIMILTDSDAAGLLHELLNSGVTPENKVITATTLEQKQVDEFGGQLNGLLMTAPTVPLTDTSNKGVAEYMAQVKAIGVSDLSVDGMIAWRAMHVVAGLIKRLPDPTSKSLMKAIEGYSFAPPEAAPVDFTKPAFPNIPMFTQFRVFSREFAAWIVKNGKIELAVPGFLNPSTHFHVTR